MYADWILVFMLLVPTEDGVKWERYESERPVTYAICQELYELKQVEMEMKPDEQYILKCEQQG